MPESAQQVLASHANLVQYAQQCGPQLAVGASPGLVLHRMAHEYSGFAITAKPSANLYVLLQAGSRTLLHIPNKRVWASASCAAWAQLPGSALHDPANL